jgi:tetratricopeptide (TPR) repeat protein
MNAVANGNSPQSRPGSRFAPLAGAAAILVAVVLAYLPALNAGFIWDDDDYVTNNPLLTAPDGLQRIWFSKHLQSQYFPLVYTTLRLQHALWALNPMGYHAVNVLLHGLCALLVWALLKRLAVRGAWLAAAIFALHPVQVESVAWITELKNTQSTLFYLLAVWAWVRFTDRETKHAGWFYGLALLLHLLALLSKTTACTLPAALVLVLWLRKQPIGIRRLGQIAPFVLLGLGMGLVSVWWESHNYSELTRFPFGGWERLLVATRALWFYAGKLLWPVNLTFSYPRWEINPGDPLHYVWGIGCVALAALLWWRRRTVGRGTIAAGVFFVAALSPMLGFFWLFTFHYSFVADHYQYLACIGPIALVASVIAGRDAAPDWECTARRAFALLLLFVLGTLTWQQTRIYRNSETLWRDTLAKNPGSWMAHNNLGLRLAADGKWTEALAHHEAALRLRPDFADAGLNLGVALKALGRTDEALAQFEAVLRLNPNDADARFNLGVVLSELGRHDQAAAHLARVLEANPLDAAAHFNLGMILARQGKRVEAIGAHQRALQLAPASPDVYTSLAGVLMEERRFDEAAQCLYTALRLKPDHAEACHNLGRLFLQQRRADEAVVLLNRAAELNPADAEVHYNLGSAYSALDRKREAVAAYQTALKLNPNHAGARAEIASLLRNQE